jgi:hypothetical protein
MGLASTHNTAIMAINTNDGQGPHIKGARVQEAREQGYWQQRRAHGPDERSPRSAAQLAARFAGGHASGLVPGQKDDKTYSWDGPHI